MQMMPMLLKCFTKIHYQKFEIVNLNYNFVSIILPVYNEEKLIKNSIKSILNQSHKNFELLVIDDGSTDNTKQIVTSIKDKRIIYIKKNHTGLSETLNCGIQLSKSDLIFRMDADDLSATNRLEIQLNFMNENPEVVLCGTFMNIINYNKKKIAKKKLPITNYEIKNTILYNSNIMHPTFCFRKSQVLEVGSYRKEFVYAQDYDLLLRLLNKDYIFANIPKYLVDYKQSDFKNIDKIYAQMRFSRLAKKLFKNRKKNEIESEINIKKIKNTKNINRFSKLIFKIFIYFNNKRINNKFPKLLWILLSYFIAIFNYELFNSLINDFIYYYKIKYAKN